MTREEAIKLLKTEQINSDTEQAHGEADDILCDLLNSLGYEDVVKEFKKIKKWYG